VARGRAEVGGGERLLESYDYRGVLRRGYALVWSEGGERLINRAAELRPGTPVHVQFQDGRADAQVTRVEPAPEASGVGEEETR
jgi:exodeoxyribonuclease VII large subunit